MFLVVPTSTITEILPQVVHTVYEPTWDIIVTQSPQCTLAITYGVVMSTGVCHFIYFQFPIKHLSISKNLMVGALHSVHPSITSKVWMHTSQGLIIFTHCSCPSVICERKCFPPVEWDWHLYQKQLAIDGGFNLGVLILLCKFICLCLC